MFGWLATCGGLGYFWVVPKLFETRARIYATEKQLADFAALQEQINRARFQDISNTVSWQKDMEGAVLSLATNGTRLADNFTRFLSNYSDLHGFTLRWGTSNIVITNLVARPGLEITNLVLTNFPMTNLIIPWPSSNDVQEFERDLKERDRKRRESKWAKFARLSQ